MGLYQTKNFDTNKMIANLTDYLIAMEYCLSINYYGDPIAVFVAMSSMLSE